MLDSGGTEGPQKKSSQQGIDDKMENLVNVRPVGCNIR